MNKPVAAETYRSARRGTWCGTEVDIVCRGRDASGIYGLIRFSDGITERVHPSAVVVEAAVPGQTQERAMNASDLGPPCPLCGGEDTTCARNLGRPVNDDRWWCMGAP
jgi:hypothetical protein